MPILMLVFLLVAFLLCGLQYLHDKIKAGECEEGGVSVYSPFLSFNRRLDTKMQYFPDPHVAWLKIYMNLLLPGVTLLNLWNLLPLLTADSAAWADVFQIIYTAGLLACVVLIRYLDGFSFWINIMVHVILAIYALLSAGPLSCFIYPLLLLNIGYFVKRRELFFLSIRQKVPPVPAYDEYGQAAVLRQIKDSRFRSTSKLKVGDYLVAIDSNSQALAVVTPDGKNPLLCPYRDYRGCEILEDTMHGCTALAVVVHVNKAPDCCIVLKGYTPDNLDLEYAQRHAWDITLLLSTTKIDNLKS